MFNPYLPELHDRSKIFLLMFKFHYIFLDFYYIIFFTNFLILLSVFFSMLHPNVFYSVLWLIVIYTGVGVLFILLGAEYIGLVFIVVYAGAIAVLFLFVIMLLDFRELEKRPLSFGVLVMYLSVVFILVELALYNLYFFPPLDLMKYYVTEILATFDFRLVFFSEPLVYLGIYFFNFYFPYFFLCGLILLVILFGVVLLLRDDLFLFQLQQDVVARYDRRHRLRKFVAVGKTKGVSFSSKNK